MDLLYDNFDETQLANYCTDMINVVRMLYSPDSTTKSINYASPINTYNMKSTNLKKLLSKDKKDGSKKSQMKSVVKELENKYDSETNIRIEPTIINTITMNPTSLDKNSKSSDDSVSLNSSSSKHNLSSNNHSDNLKKELWGKSDKETLKKLGLDSSDEDEKSTNSSKDDENFETDHNTPIPISSIPLTTNITSPQVKKKDKTNQDNKSQSKKRKQLLSSPSDSNLQARPKKKNSLQLQAIGLSVRPSL
jgi:hypothetical protein